MENNHKRYLFLALLIAGCLATSLAVKLWPASDTSVPMNSITQLPQAKAKKTSNLIKVYVSGAVLQPGLYEVAKDARAEEAIAAAGGLREDANLERVNLARKLRDGMQINVPALVVKTARKNNISQGNFSHISKNNQSNKNPNLNISQSYYNEYDQQLHKGRVNVNTATAEQLQQVPGIGPVMAKRIIACRKEHRFQNISDLKRVKGIGESTLIKLRPYIEVG